MPQLWVGKCCMEIMKAVGLAESGGLVQLTVDDGRTLGSGWHTPEALVHWKQRLISRNRGVGWWRRYLRTLAQASVDASTSCTSLPEPSKIARPTSSDWY
ncbi:hypothetical protein BDW22DRAFT_901022 [Trametopsis cervina]|nr:hypothetical protein BDW22DRAFT_901022 [Trametopsis cervina]